ncbi:MAG: hypothetical protein ACHQLQ_02015 [Candidatus Acidiferrales bacterium]
MTRHLHFLVFLGLSMFLPSCGGQNLTRDKALSLANANSKYLLKPESEVFWSTAPFASDKNECSHQMSAGLEFMERAVAAGLIRATSTQKKSVLGGGLFGSPNPEVNTETLHYYDVVDQPFAMAERSNPALGNQQILEIKFRLSQSAFKAVTGIQQEGPRAVVTFEVEKTPTDVYLKLSSIKAELQKQGAACRLNWVWLPPVDQVQNQTSVHFPFTKYDDGWRLGN